MNLLDKTIDRLKAFEPEEGYYGAFSGGEKQPSPLSRRATRGRERGLALSENLCGPAATAALHPHELSGCDVAYAEADDVSTYT